MKINKTEKKELLKIFNDLNYDTTFLFSEEDDEININNEEFQLLFFISFIEIKKQIKEIQNQICDLKILLNK